MVRGCYNEHDSRRLPLTRPPAAVDLSPQAAIECTHLSCGQLAGVIAWVDG